VILSPYPVFFYILFLNSTVFQVLCKHHYTLLGQGVLVQAISDVDNFVSNGFLKRPVQEGGETSEKRFHSARASSLCDQPHEQVMSSSSWLHCSHRQSSSRRQPSFRRQRLIRSGAR
jgi:hypothetical protein